MPNYKSEVYHLRFGKRRTTVSVDKIVSNLLAIKLGFEPETPEAHSAVRKHLQETVRRVDIRHPSGASNSLQHWVILLDLADERLSKKYLDWNSVNYRRNH